MIPKIIHYCWLSDDPIPEYLKRYMSSWENELQGYQIVKWDFSRFDKKSSKWVSDAFDNKKYAFAADYIRLYAIYHYGGIYLDMDVEVLKSFDPFMELNSMVGWQQGKNGLEVAAFGAEKGCSWIKCCLDYYKDRNFIKDNGTFDTFTLPLIVENQLKNNGYKLIDVLCIDDAKHIFKKDTIPVFPESYFSPKSYSTGKINLTSETRCIHHFKATWRPWEQVWEKKIWDFFGIKSHPLFTWHIDSLLSHIGIKR